MGKGNASRNRSHSWTSDKSTPEARSAGLVDPDDKSDLESQDGDRDHGDVKRAGEEMLSLLKGVDQKKLIALLQGRVSALPLLILRITWLCRTGASFRDDSEHLNSPFLAVHVPCVAELRWTHNQPASAHASRARVF